jgi:uncharacterized cupredoxin-like copper-binding protein
MGPAQPATPSVPPVSPAPPASTPSPAPTIATPPAIEGRIEISMTDAMRFEPDRIRVRAGEHITFVVTNRGAIRHEFVVGDEATQAEHAAAMAQGGHGHDDPNVLSLAPGESGTLEMRFDTPGRLLIGCHEPGHYEAGMVGELEVVP